ncbi:ATP/GTP-binding protein [Streptomyces sp. NPDC058268]|uniref:GTP-binding protein n=1 Tax=Streptomyces sp. NPDC058268 TaxID=3346413 RepID=UPI0036E856F6
MVSANSDTRYVPDHVTRSVKIVVLGAFGVGKTTYVEAVSEIKILNTEERMTQAGELVDSLAGLENKETTTVAMDFGRLTVTDEIVLYLFGAPGQPRFHHTVRALMTGAIAGLVLVDTRQPERVAESFTALNLLDEVGLPYAVAVNSFEGHPQYPEEQIRRSLDLDPDIPLVFLDARHRASAKAGLIALVEHLLSFPALELSR